jgi:hypothetical protein
MFLLGKVFHWLCDPYSVPKNLAEFASSHTETPAKLITKRVPSLTDVYQENYDEICSCTHTISHDFNDPILKSPLA